MRWLLVLLVGCVSARAATPALEVKIEGLIVPFFDPAGQLTHKLLAARGSGHGDARRLEDVQVLYFAPGEPAKVVRRVTAADAVWAEHAGTLAGTGPIKVETEDSQLSGTGFDFVLATSVLRIHRDFRMADPEFILTGDHAIADLIVEKQSDKLALRDIRRCEVVDNLHFVSLKKDSKLPQEAFTDLAVYDGTARTITMPHEVRAAGTNAKGASRTMIIHLSPRR